MGRFFVTGDTHGDIDLSKLNKKNFSLQRELGRDDYVIICGDFGAVWYGDRKCPLKVKEQYEVPKGLEKMWGKDTYLLDWYDDKPFTTLFLDGNHENHVLLNSYPAEELPDAGEYRRALENMEKNNWKVDYMLSHDAPEKIRKELHPEYGENELAAFLSMLQEKAEYKYWYFGHHHADKEFGKHRCVFQNVIEIFAKCDIIRGCNGLC